MGTGTNADLLTLLIIAAVVAVVALSVWVARKSGRAARSAADGLQTAETRRQAPVSDPARLAEAAATANAAPFAGPFQPDPGYTLIGVGRDAPFAGQSGEHADISAMIAALLREVDMSGNARIRTSADRYPAAWSEPLDIALGLKRAGEFRESTNAYITLFRDAGVVYSGALDGLYKAVAASGALRAARDILALGQAIMVADPKAREMLRSWGGPSLFEERQADLARAARSREELEEYLRAISGNVNYRLTRDFEDAVRELDDA